MTTTRPGRSSPAPASGSRAKVGSGSGPVQRSSAAGPSASRSSSAGTSSARSSRARFAARARLARRRHRRPLLLAAAVVVLVVGLAVFAYAGPALVVREVTVTGVSVTRVAAVRQAAGITPGRPLAQVDVDAIDDRVGDLPFVAQVRVSRHLPGTVRVDVLVRQAAALVPVAGGGYRIVDAGGVPFARAAKPLRGVPVIKVSLAQSARPALQAALAVLAALPEPVRAKVGAVTASTPDDVRFTVGPATVVWGSVERSDRKAAIYAALRRTPAKVYDLSSPDTPVLR